MQYPKPQTSKSDQVPPFNNMSLDDPRDFASAVFDNMSRDDICGFMLVLALLVWFLTNRRYTSAIRGMYYATLAWYYTVLARLVESDGFKLVLAVKLFVQQTYSKAPSTVELLTPKPKAMSKEHESTTPQESHPVNKLLVNWMDEDAEEVWRERIKANEREVLEANERRLQLRREALDD